MLDADYYPLAAAANNLAKSKVDYYQNEGVYLMEGQILEKVTFTGGEKWKQTRINTLEHQDGHFIEKVAI